MVTSTGERPPSVLLLLGEPAFGLKSPRLPSDWYLRCLTGFLFPGLLLLGWCGLRLGGDGVLTMSNGWLPPLLLLVRLLNSMPPPLSCRLTAAAPRLPSCEPSLMCFCSRMSLLSLPLLLLLSP